MNVIGTVAIVVLATWTLGSFCFVFRISPLHEALKRLNWFRTFAHWTMFAANPEPNVRPGGFVILFRDEPDREWSTAIDGHEWAWHSFLFNPRRLLAARIHHLGQFYAAVGNRTSASEADPDLRRHEDVIASYLHRVRPLAAGKTRTVRIVKRFGRSSPNTEELTWEFMIGRDG